MKSITGKTGIETLLKSLPKDSVYAAFRAPEPLLMWTSEYKWREELFSDHGMKLLAAKMRFAVTLAEDKSSFSRTKPWKISDGLRIEGGYKKNRNRLTVVIEQRFDDVIDLNHHLDNVGAAIDEECPGIKTFTTKKLLVFSEIHKTTIEYQIFDPNKSGEDLYTAWIKRQGEESKPFYKVDYFTQERVLGGFTEAEYKLCSVRYSKEPQIILDCETKKRRKM